MGSEKYPVENDFDAFMSKHGGSENAFTESGLSPILLVDMITTYSLTAIGSTDHQHDSVQKRQLTTSASHKSTWEAHWIVYHNSSLRPSC